MTVDIAFIGAGGIGSIHLNNIEDVDAANVVAICDVSEDAATTAADRFDATAYTDHEEMLEAESLDALFVAVPPFAHTNQETLAVEHDIDLFVEKPIAVSASTAETVDDAIAAAGVHSQVGHMYRYASVVERAKEILDGRDVALLDGRWLGGVPPSGWWGVKEKSGGQLVEQTAHIFDLVRYFGGEVDDVCAASGKNVVGDEIDFYDTASATMTHENGAVSHVSTSSASPEELIDLHVVGDGVKLHLEFRFEGEDPPRALGRLTGTVDGERIELEDDEDAWKREVEAFVEAVETDDASLLRSPYRDARGTFELTLSVDDALESAVPEAVKQ
ncbi:Gfo/Idh/MocA family protein [Halogeometricum limi]|uniref:Predicted dehydrogenase n=1 Tax=Halogeometricum limi TaxID=555875 RepID=A0A1I6IDA0_9EURY|nr:Gfo/Idh/MocA family oxidoreductase [Halogeometricum limi]SFR64745.1 Predicted dehydrogenase [Halogeometricum limi]